MSHVPSGPTSPSALDRFLPLRRSFEIGYWVVSFCLSAAVNSVTELMDYQREGRPIRLWEPMVWEWSSALASLALVPAVLWFTARYPLHFDTWRRRVALYLGGSVAWSLLHVLGMVGLRKMAYALQGGQLRLRPLAA